MNYKQTLVSGESWVRATKIVIENPLNSTPTIQMYEEQVTNIGDRIMVEPQGVTLSCQFDPAASFPLYNYDGTPYEAMPSITHEQLYNILNSLYIKLRTERDAA